MCAESENKITLMRLRSKEEVCPIKVSPFATGRFTATFNFWGFLRYREWDEQHK